MGYPTLDEWEHAGIITVPLSPIDGKPGYDADLELPDLQQFIADGRIPEVLVRIAMRVETEGVDEEREMLTPEDFARYLDLQYLVLARCLRRPSPLEEFGGDLERAAAWVRDKMPGLHRYELWRRAMHLDLNLGGLQRAMRSVDDLAAFRDRIASEGVPAGGGAVGEVAG